MNRRAFLTILAAGLLARHAQAQTAPSQRIRGTIAALSGNMLTIDSRDGAKIEILLADPLTVSTVRKVDLASIGPGTYIGTATRAAAGGRLVAIEVLVFPEAMRGAGEGHYAWDLEPGSMMTNATVSGVVSATDGRTLSLSYKGGNNEVVVPPDVPVVTFAPATRADLKPGARFFLAARPNADGKLATGRVTVETAGVAPPM
ncbi:MAG: hypothetical protein AB7O80_13610 [Acetobacteraceae bacterium]